MVCRWAQQPTEGVEPRLAFQLVHEAALCVTGIRRVRHLSQRGFELLNGLPFVASDLAIHNLLEAHTVADAEALQVHLGLLRRARGHFCGKTLAIDPHRMRSYSKRLMRRYRGDNVSKPIKVNQAFFCLDTETEQPVCFTIGSSGQPVSVNMHDFPDPELGKVIPYGVYDIGRNEGWVCVGVTHDTAEFAVETIRRWWFRMGRLVYPKARQIPITADGGGSNGARVRLWKVELQRLADELGMILHVRHFPPGTSKWNKIEHRMFCHITENWRARPLSTVLAIVNLIGNTRTKGGLSIQSELNETHYEIGKKISDEAMQSLNIIRCEFHGEWNYSIAAIAHSPA